MAVISCICVLQNRKPPKSKTRWFYFIIYFRLPLNQPEKSHHLSKKESIKNRFVCLRAETVCEKQKFKVQIKENDFFLIFLKKVSKLIKKKIWNYQKLNSFKLCFVFYNKLLNFYCLFVRLLSPRGVKAHIFIKKTF